MVFVVVVVFGMGYVPSVTWFYLVLSPGLSPGLMDICSHSEDLSLLLSTRKVSSR